MKSARRMLAWVLAAALVLTNGNYVRAEGDSGDAYRPEENVSGIAEADEGSYPVASGTSDDPSADVAVLYSGSESGVTWKITSDSVLTISGEKLADTPKLRMRWLERQNDFTKVVITAGNIDSTVGWFEGCSNITEIDLSGFDTGTVTDMRRMFDGCTGITMLKTFPNLRQKVALPVEMQGVDRTVYEFFPIRLAESILLYRYEDGSEFGVKRAIGFDGTLLIYGVKFEGAPSPTGEIWKGLKDQFTKVKVTAGNIDSTAGWFEGCGNITEIDLSEFDTGKVTDMSRMFYGCSGITDLDIRSVTDMSEMFDGCVGVKTLKTFANL
ncbi:MAG: BspA family leucine-rich repeat surface protein [Muribaculum sp.]|nr:BspA family leucine-rich repeat surface protein [Muribaculum sp.]